MRDISEIFKLTVFVCVISSILLIFIDGTKLKEKVKFLNGIIILSLILQMLSPMLTELQKLINIFPSDNEISNPSESESEENLIKESARQMALYVKELVCGKYSIPKEETNVSVTLEKEEESVSVKHITVSLTENNMSLGEDIAKYVSSLMGCGCTVIEL